MKFRVSHFFNSVYSFAISPESRVVRRADLNSSKLLSYWAFMFLKSAPSCLQRRSSSNPIENKNWFIWYQFSKNLVSSRSVKHLRNRAHLCAGMQVFSFKYCESFQNTHPGALQPLRYCMPLQLVHCASESIMWWHTSITKFIADS